MISRKALLIANPGKPGADNYCEGVNRDMENYAAYLRNPYGGSWRSSEISTLDKPTSRELRDAIGSLPLYDYSLIVFCGHAYYSSRAQSTVLEINDTTTIDSAELRTGSTKQSLILDCCRKIERPMLLEKSILEKAAKAVRLPDPQQCRKYYDQHIEECEEGLVVMHACDIDETAGDDSRKGGWYSSSLLGVAFDWGQSNHVDAHQYAILSVASAHSQSRPKVITLSGDRQHPQIEKPRADKFFPFAVIA